MLFLSFHLAGLSHTSNKNQFKTQEGDFVLFASGSTTSDHERDVSYKPSHTTGHSQSTGLRLWTAGDL